MEKGLPVLFLNHNTGPHVWVAIFTSHRRQAKRVCRLHVHTHTLVKDDSYTLPHAPDKTSPLRSSYNRGKSEAKGNQKN